MVPVTLTLQYFFVILLGLSKQVNFGLSYGYMLKRGILSQFFVVGVITAEIFHPLIIVQIACIGSADNMCFAFVLGVVVLIFECDCGNKNFTFRLGCNQFFIFLILMIYEYIYDIVVFNKKRKLTFLIFILELLSQKVSWRQILIYARQSVRLKQTSLRGVLQMTYQILKYSQFV